MSSVSISHAGVGLEITINPGEGDPITVRAEPGLSVRETLANEVRSLKDEMERIRRRIVCIEDAAMLLGQ